MVHYTLKWHRNVKVYATVTSPLLEMFATPPSVGEGQGVGANTKAQSMQGCKRKAAKHAKRRRGLNHPLRSLRPLR